MAKIRTTLAIHEEVLRAVEARAARTGKDDGDVVEEALRRHLGLELLERTASDARAGTRRPRPYR